MEGILFIAIFFFSFCLRLAFHIFSSGDEQESYWSIQRQVGKAWVNYSIPDSVLDGHYYYPVLPHFLISRFPQKLWGVFGTLINASYDLLTAIPVYFGTQALASPFGVTSIAGLSPGLASTLLFLTYPILFFPRQPRMLTIKGRAMGLTLITLFYSLQILGVTQGQWLFAIPSIGVGLLVILSSQFGIQVMIFFAPFISILIGSWTPIYIVASTFLAAYILPIGTKEILTLMLNHKLWFSKNIGHGTPAQNKNKFSDYSALFKTLFNDPHHFIFLCVNKLSVVLLGLCSPLLLILAITILIPSFHWETILTDPSLRYLTAITTASFVIFLFVLHPKAAAVGEAERYTEYSAPSVCILLTILTLQMSPQNRATFFWILLCVNLSFLFLGVFLVNYTVIWKNTPTMTAELKELLQWLKQTPQGRNIGVVRCKGAFLFSFFFNQLGIKNKLFFRHTYRKGERGYKYMDDHMGGLSSLAGNTSFDVFLSTPERLNEEFGLDSYIISKEIVDALSATWGVKTLSDILTIQFENSAYLFAEYKRP